MYQIEYFERGRLDNVLADVNAWLAERDLSDVKTQIVFQSGVVQVYVTYKY